MGRGISIQQRFSKLFEPGKIGTLELRNRIAMAPMLTRQGDHGYVTERAIDYYGERARGGAALIIVETTRAWVEPAAFSLFDDKFVPGMRKLADAIHQGGAKAAVQLQPGRGRANREANTELAKDLEGKVELHLIGDCAQPVRIEQATEAAFRVALQI